MPTTAKRRLTLLDAMILVAAMGMGLGLVRLDYLAWEAAYGGGVRPSRCEGPLLVLVAMALGALVLRLLPPRPRRRRLLRQPGTLALIGILVTVIVSSADLIPERFAPTRANWAFATIIGLLHITLPLNLATGVVLGWVIGMIQGLRLRGADWVEWLGRTLGVAVLAIWIILTASLCFG